jgi:hypothetical protein
MVLPLLASCLALTLLAGTLLTMFTARRALPSTMQTTSVPRPSRPAVGQVGGLLPEASVTVGSGRSAALRDFHPSVLALVPAGCRCEAAARQLSRQAATASVNLYFVAAGSAVGQARTLARRSGLSGDHVVTDSRDVMGSTYQTAGLTAVLVDKDGAVRSIRRDLGPAAQLQNSLRALAKPTPEGLDEPGDTMILAGQAALRPA